MNINTTQNQIVLSTKGVKAEIEPGKTVTIVSDSSHVIDWPGEYEAGGVSVRAFSVPNGEIAFLVSLDEVRVFFPPHSSLEAAEEDLKKIGDAESVIIPVGASSWTPREWKKFLEEMDPRVVIFSENGEKTEALRKEMGIAEVESESSIEVSQTNLPTDKTRYVVLDTSG